MNIGKTIYQAGNTVKQQAIAAARKSVEQATTETSKFVGSAVEQITGQEQTPQEPKHELNEPNIDQQKIQDENYRKQRSAQLKADLDAEMARITQVKQEQYRKATEAQNQQSAQTAQETEQKEKKGGLLGKVKNKMQGVMQKMTKRERKQGPSG